MYLPLPPTRTQRLRAAAEERSTEQGAKRARLAKFMQGGSVAAAILADVAPEVLALLHPPAAAAAASR